MPPHMPTWITLEKARWRWRNMIRRCFDPTHHKYPRYGGRGITVCQRWVLSRESFFDDMGWPPSPKHSIDRMDNDGNYEPTNCRWATATEQANNRSRRSLFTIPAGVILCAGVTKKMVYLRVKLLGWTLERACEAPRTVKPHTRRSRKRS